MGIKVSYDKDSKKFSTEKTNEFSAYAPKMPSVFIWEKGYKDEDEISPDKLKELAFEYLSNQAVIVNKNQLNNYIDLQVKELHSYNEELAVGLFEPIIGNFNEEILHSEKINYIFKDWGKWR